MAAEKTRTTECRIRRSPHPSLTWPQVLEILSHELGWNADAEVYAYCESVSTTTLTCLALSAFEPPIDAIEGRLFKDPAEARWRRREDDGAYDVWLVREYLDTNAEREKVLRVTPDRRYYLIGLETERPGVFREARYHPRQFHYPVPAADPPVDGNGQPADPAKRRAFIMVAEYERPEPSWGQITDEVAVTTRLDEPLLCAHRFVSVGADWGE